MKVIICGGRDYKFEEEDWEVLNYLHDRYKFTEVVSGGAKGADIEGERWAKQNRVPVKRFEVSEEDWKREGLSAGPMRNNEMAAYADACIAFPGNKGTADMVKKAKAYRLIVWDFRGSDALRD